MTLLDSSTRLLRSVLRWTVRLLVPLVVVFVVAEQVEAHRLGAIAACEGAATAPDNCLRQRGYQGLQVDNRVVPAEDHLTVYPSTLSHSVVHT